MSKSTKPSMTIIGTVVGAVAIGAIVMAQTNGKPVGKTTAAPSANGTKDAPVQIVIADRKPLEFYTGGVRNDLFNGPIPEAPKPKIDPKATKRAVLPLDIPAAPVEVNPFSDYTYSGTVTMNGEVIALVENNKTRDGQYLHIGDSFLGGKIGQITEKSLNISLAGKEEILAKSDSYKLVPLDKSAPFMAQQSQQPAGPGAPGMPGMAVPGLPGAAGMPSWMQNMPADAQARMKARMDAMTPEQRDQMATRMNNRQFNGGGGGGMGGGRGNGGGGGRGNRGGGGFGGGMGGFGG